MNRKNFTIIFFGCTIKPSEIFEIRKIVVVVSSYTEVFIFNCYCILGSEIRRTVIKMNNDVFDNSDYFKSNLVSTLFLIKRKNFWKYLINIKIPLVTLFSCTWLIFLSTFYLYFFNGIFLVAIIFYV